MAMSALLRPLLLPLALTLSAAPPAASLALPVPPGAAPPPQLRRAVVVGAGPVGIAAALTLASSPHNCSVTLLESSPASSAQTEYDPTKAFLYNVNLRGQAFTKQFPRLHEGLVERSVPSGGFGGSQLTIVPADPEVEIPLKQDTLRYSGKKDGKKGEDDNAEEDGDEMKGSMQSEKAVGVGYWIPRHEMVKLMAECVAAHNEESRCKIELLTAKECVSVAPADAKEGRCVRVEIRDADSGVHSVYDADFVVGADGMYSRVGRCLASSPPDRWHFSRGIKPRKFELKKWTSPASYLRIKVLQFPPRFEIPNAPGKLPLTTRAEGTYALRSVKTGPRDYLSLGLLPMKDNYAVRPTNIVTRPDHEVWTITDGPTMREYFQSCFPRFNFEKDAGMISEAEWDRFAKAQGTRFPPCQRSEGLAAWDSSGASGVALVGDACHAFSPDIGQGVNAGLMDVVCLDRALRGLDPATGEEVATTTGGEDGPELRRNLDRYQRRHAPEVAALIRLARFGAPYQYRQPHRADRVLAKLWTANVVLRLLLNKLTFGLVPQHCIMLSQDKDLTFRQVMRRADITSRALKGAALAVMGAWAWRRGVWGKIVGAALPS
ncbi:hypothetical protein ACHAWF_017924 [Thalassiosira exigua]